MVRFRNRLTGGSMWVHESRVEEYKAAGHLPAAETPAKPEAKTEEKPKRARAKK